MRIRGIVLAIMLLAGFAGIAPKVSAQEIEPCTGGLIYDIESGNCIPTDSIPDGPGSCGDPVIQPDSNPEEPNCGTDDEGHQPWRFGPGGECPLSFTLEECLDWHESTISPECPNGYSFNSDSGIYECAPEAIGNDQPISDEILNEEGVPDEYAWISADGDGAICRDAANGSQVALLIDGTEVGVIYDDTDDGWQEVVVWGYTCYIFGDLLLYEYPEVPEAITPQLETAAVDDNSTDESTTPISALPSTGTGSVEAEDSTWQKTVIGALFAIAATALVFGFIIVGMARTTGSRNRR